MDLQLRPGRIAEQLTAARDGAVRARDDSARSRDEAIALIAELEPLIQRRRTYDLEIETGIAPSFDPDDAEFVRSLQASEGSYERGATWQLPSGLILSGADVEALPDLVP